MAVEVRLLIGPLFIFASTAILGCSTPHDHEEIRLSPSDSHNQNGQLSSEEIDIICALIRAIADDDFVLTGCCIDLKHLRVTNVISGENPLDRWPVADRQPGDAIIAAALVSRNQDEIDFNSDSLRQIGERLREFDFRRDGHVFQRKAGNAVAPSIHVAVAIPGTAVIDGMACTFAEITNSEAGSSYVVWSKFRRTDDGWRCLDRKIIGFE